jgi:uncharacterized protein YecT (DUF1311 family)
MRRVGLVAICVLALAAMAGPAPAHADEFESYREDGLLRCVADAGTDQDALRRCIGAGANPCIATDGSATSSSVLCWSAEADSWRAILQRAVTDLNASHSYRDPQRLAAANTAWEAWVEAECDYWAWEEGGGSGEQVDRVQCLARVTGERAIALRIAAAPR